MATLLGTLFSAADNQVSQCDDQTFGSIAETLVINFDQEKFEQLLTGGSKNPLRVRKHIKVSVANVSLATLGSKSRLLRFFMNLILPYARLIRLCASLNWLYLSLS